MTIYALHGVYSIIMFFTSSFIIISLLGEDKLSFLNKIYKNDKSVDTIASILVIICFFAFFTWLFSVFSYISRSNFSEESGYGGYSKEKYEEEVKKYNKNYNANIETHDDFVNFVELQWKIGNHVRNIGYLIIIIFYLIMVLVEFNMNKLERKLEKIRESIWELSDIPNPDDQTKQLLDLLSKTKKKLEKQIQLKSVSKSIKMLKQIQADESTVDITREIDELTALYQLNETDLLKEKYQ